MWGIISILIVGLVLLIVGIILVCTDVIWGAGIVGITVGGTAVLLMSIALPVTYYACKENTEYLVRTYERLKDKTDETYLIEKTDHNELLTACIVDEITYPAFYEYDVDFLETLYLTL